jgi:hypothetical protein
MPQKNPDTAVPEHLAHQIVSLLPRELDAEVVLLGRLIGDSDPGAPLVARGQAIGAEVPGSAHGVSFGVDQGQEIHPLLPCGLDGRRRLDRAPSLHYQADPQPLGILGGVQIQEALVAGLGPALGHGPARFAGGGAAGGVPIA